MRRVPSDLGDDAQLFSSSAIELDHATDVGRQDIRDLCLTIGAKMAVHYLVPPARCVSYRAGVGDAIPRFVEGHDLRPLL